MESISRVDVGGGVAASSDNTWLSSLGEWLIWHAETMAAETEAGKELMSFPFPATRQDQIRSSASSSRSSARCVYISVVDMSRWPRARLTMSRSEVDA